MQKPIADAIQHVALGSTMGMGAMTWIAHNATALTVIITLSTSIVFAIAALWNAKSKSRMIDVHKRSITADLIETMKINGATSDEIKLVKDYIRRKY